MGNRNEMRLPVTKQAKREYINEQRCRYRQAATRHEQRVMLDEMMQVTHYHRKYLIRVLSKKRVESNCSRRSRSSIVVAGGNGSVKTTAGRPPVYDAPEFIAFLRYLWHATNQACGKRLKSVLPLWLPWYEQATGVRLSLLHQTLLTRMAHSTIDRLLAEERSHYRIGKGRATTKPGTLQIRKRIPIKTDQWMEKRPGFLEVDTVAHCGTSMAGMFVYSLNTVDVGSGWVEARAVWGKGERGVLEALTSIEQALPFRLRGVDCDNGGEFINHHMEKYLRGRKRSVEYTRSREYNKNDNAHIEQNNWTHIRQLLGYERFDNPGVITPMNDLYAQEYSLLMNFFLPSVKLQDKQRVESKIVKRHDQPQTPCQRLLSSPMIPEQTKLRLRHLQHSLNPFLLHTTVRQKIKEILTQRSLVSPSLRCSPALSPRLVTTATSTTIPRKQPQPHSHFPTPSRPLPRRTLSRGINQQRFLSGENSRG